MEVATRVQKVLSHFKFPRQNIIQNRDLRQQYSVIIIIKISSYMYSTSVLVAPHHLGSLINVSNAIYFHYNKTTDEFNVNYGLYNYLLNIHGVPNSVYYS